MKKITLLVGTIVSFLAFADAQVVQITSGAAYKKQTFYSLSNDAKTTINNTDWDIAFSVYGQQDAGVHLNESVGSGETPVKLYKAPSNDFTKVITAAEVKDSLYNDEVSWGYGAFNTNRDLANPFDYGWGAYSTATNQVVGAKVFVLRLRNGSLRKIEIQKLNLTVYTFRHANLDGTDEKVVTLDKAKFTGKTLAYYSFATNTVKDLEPAGNFDLLYTRYVSRVEQNGVIADYPLLGVLTGRGVSAAKAAKIDPKTVKASDYATKYEKRTDVIGYDWKTFNLTDMKWSVAEDLAYFVKVRNGDIYKIVFVDFEGSATGTASFEKTKSLLVATMDTYAKDLNFKVFPTLAENEIQVAFDNKNNENYDIIISDMTGRLLSQNSLSVGAGFQVNSLNISDLARGSYVVTLKSNKGFATAKFVKM
jgi:hypothetical protein